MTSETNAIVTAVYSELLASPGDGYGVIKRALLAERDRQRERDARIAENYDDDPPDRLLGTICEHIATAIRKGELT